MKLNPIKLYSIPLIACLGLIVYSNTFLSSFHLDDFQLIVDNAQIKDAHHLGKIWYFLPCRFLLYLSFALDYQFHQLRVLGYHVENLAIHLASAMMVWWLVLLTFSTPVMKKTTNEIPVPSEWIALFAGLIFVAHPIQTEAVTYIAQRAASLMTLFYLASVCLYVKSRLVPSLRRTSVFYYIFSLVLALMAMFTKETAITLPLIILLYEISFLKDEKGLNWKKLLPMMLTLLVIPLTMVFFSSTKAINFQEIDHALKGASEISEVQYVLTEIRVLVTYIRLCFLPLNQNIDYDYHIFNHHMAFPVILSLLFLIAILGGAMKLFDRYRIVSFSICWFFITLLPESSLFPIKDVIFEHRLYLPMVGYSIFLAAGLFYVLAKTAFRTIALILIGIILGYSALAYQRNKVWKDEFTLWDDAARKSPHKVRPYINRGNAYFYKGNITEALSDYNKAIELNADDEVAYSNRGYLYIQQGNFTQAMADLHQAIKINPIYPHAFFVLGLAFEARKNSSQALNAFTRAIELNPHYLEAYAKGGFLYYASGNIPKAMADFNKVIELNPLNAEIFNARGVLYGQKHDLNHALSDFTIAIDIDPPYAAAYYNRAGTFYQIKAYDQAWRDLQRALRLGYAVNPGLINEMKRSLDQSR